MHFKLPEKPEKKLAITDAARWVWAPDFVVNNSEGEKEVGVDDGKLVPERETAALSVFTALELVRERNEHLPFTFVVASMSEPAAIKAFEKGATDYILKDRPARLLPSVLRALRDAQRTRDLVESVKERRELEERVLRAQRLESIGRS